MWKLTPITWSLIRVNIEMIKPLEVNIDHFSDLDISKTFFLGHLKHKV